MEVLSIHLFLGPRMSEEGIAVVWRKKKKRTRSLSQDSTSLLRRRLLCLVFCILTSIHVSHIYKLVEVVRLYNELR